MTVDSGPETLHRRILGVEQHHLDPIPGIPASVAEQYDAATPES